MVLLNVKMNFDHSRSVNILNSVILTLFSLQELIFINKKKIFFDFGFIYYGLHVCCERLYQQLEEVKEMGLWKEAECSIHKCSRLSELCDCS